MASDVKQAIHVKEAIRECEDLMEGWPPSLEADGAPQVQDRLAVIDRYLALRKESYLDHIRRRFRGKARFWAGPWWLTAAWHSGAPRQGGRPIFALA